MGGFSELVVLFVSFSDSRQGYKKNVFFGVSGGGEGEGENGMRKRGRRLDLRKGAAHASWCYKKCGK